MQGRLALVTRSFSPSAGPVRGSCQVEANIVRCPDPEAAERMIKRIDKIRVTGDSIGGVVECVARNVPAGLGSPVFDKLEAELAKACMSLPASKGFEVRVSLQGKERGIGLAYKVIPSCITFAEDILELFLVGMLNSTGMLTAGRQHIELEGFRECISSVGLSLVFPLKV